MDKIWIPQEDVNSQGADIVRWVKEENGLVEKNEAVCEVETSKAIFEVLAPNDGYLIHLSEEGEFVEYNQAIGIIASDEIELAKLISEKLH